jgi:S-ribosylhomocysteine lyase
MDSIPSFSVNHLNLKQGLYLAYSLPLSFHSINAFDVRLKVPYTTTISPEAMHSLEHGFATIARNSNYRDKVVAVTPMACLTGMYFILIDVPVSLFSLIFLSWASQFLELTEVPGATKEQCGNADFQNLEEAKQVVRDFITVFNENPLTTYPDE